MCGSASRSSPETISGRRAAAVALGLDARAWRSPAPGRRAPAARPRWPAARRRLPPRNAPRAKTPVATSSSPRPAAARPPRWRRARSASFAARRASLVAVRADSLIVRTVGLAALVHVRAQRAASDENVTAAALGRHLHLLRRRLQRRAPQHDLARADGNARQSETIRPAPRASSADWGRPGRRRASSNGCCRRSRPGRA